MIAPKRAVMIHNLARAINDSADISPEDQVHPSLASHSQPGQKTRTRSLSADHPAHESAPITCSTCRMTYLPSAVPAASAPPEDWVCDGCQQSLV
jgi:hypothetical protein